MHAFGKLSEAKVELESIRRRSDDVTSIVVFNRKMSIITGTKTNLSGLHSKFRAKNPYKQKAKAQGLATTRTCKS